MDFLQHQAPDAAAFIHPEDEDAVAALVRSAAADGRHVRVRGAGHSPPDSHAAERPGDLVISLDRMRSLTVLDLKRRLVRVQAGIHLGRDPSAFGDDGFRENTLLHQLAERYGWTLSTTGGITHQTIGGFLATCSSGGSVQHSLLDHVVAVRLIDGRGEIREFSDVGDGPGLAAVLPSLGLLGVIVAVTLRCDPAFAISGQEAIVDFDSAPVDFEGPGDGDKLSLEDFLTRAEYARIDWWPQRGAERFLVWQAQQAELQPGFRPTRYEEFTRYPVLGEALFSTIFVIFGNRSAPDRLRGLMRRNADWVSDALDTLAERGQITRGRRRMLWTLPAAMRAIGAAAPLLRLLDRPLDRSLPWLVPFALNNVLPFDTRKPGMRRGEPQAFRDYAWEGLPMDNQASDVLLWTQFIELWVPLSQGAEVVKLLRAFFAEPRDIRESYRRTGLYSWELYAAKPASGWIHPAHTDGEDEWSGGALRVDIFWFTDNLEDPRERFYPQFWDLLREHGVRFRSHWGKELPLVEDGDPLSPATVYPQWAEWRALREELDPDGVFLTDYWRERLGLR